MAQIVLIRPGSTEYDREGRIQGTLDIPLSEEGRQEVRHVIEQLQGQAIEALYATPSQAAAETGRAIAEALHLKLKKLVKCAISIRDCGRGCWSMTSRASIRRCRASGRSNPRRCARLVARWSARRRPAYVRCLSRLLKKHKDGVIGLVVPEPLASVVRNVLRHDSLGDLWKASAGERWEIITVGPNATVCD